MLAAVATQETAALTASAIAEELVATLGARSAAVHFADGDERTLRLVASCNMPEAPAELFVFEKDGNEPAKCSARSRLLFLTSDDDERDGTLFAVPLLSGSRLLGAVTCELPARLESRELASLDAMGVVFGALVDRARRAEECRVSALNGRASSHTSYVSRSTPSRCTQRCSTRRLRAATWRRPFAGSATA